MMFLKSQMELGIKPEVILQNLLGPSFQIVRKNSILMSVILVGVVYDLQPPNADDVSLWEAVLEIVFRPPARDPLQDVSTLNDVIRLINNSHNIIVLSGAGV